MCVKQHSLFCIIGEILYRLEPTHEIQIYNWNHFLALSPSTEKWLEIDLIIILFYFSTRHLLFVMVTLLINKFFEWDTYIFCVTDKHFCSLSWVYLFVFCYFHVTIIFDKVLTLTIIFSLNNQFYSQSLPANTISLQFSDWNYFHFNQEKIFDINSHYFRFMHIFFYH